MPEKFIPPTDAIEEEKFIPPSDVIVKEVKKKEDTTPTSKSVSTSSNTASKSTSQNQNKAPIGTIQAGQNPNTYGIGNVLPITEEQKKAGKELLGQGTKIAETTKKQTTSENKNTYPTPQELLKQSGGIGSDVTKDLKQKVDIKAKQIEQFGTKTAEQREKEKEEEAERQKKQEFDNQIDQMLVAESSVFGNENVKDNILDYFEINLKANDLENRLSKEDKALYETINKVDDFRNKLTLLDTQYKNGDLSEFTYKQQYDKVKKESSTLEYQATTLIEQRNKDIENEIKSLKTQLANGKKEVVGTTNVSGGIGTLGAGLGSYTQQVSLSENDRKEIQKQIKILEAKKGLFTDNIKQQEQIDSFKPEIAKLKEKKIIPDGANVKESLKLLYAQKHKKLQELIKKSKIEGKASVSSQKGWFGKAKEYIADKFLESTETGQTVAGYENPIRQYLIEDETSKDIYNLQEELNTLAPIIALNRYGTYKNESEWAKFGKTFTQSLIPTKQGKILTETEIAQNTQKIINDLGLSEIKGVTEKDIQDNKYSVGEMLGTTGAFMVQFSIPTGGGQAMALVKGISALAKIPKLIKIADKVNDIVNYTQKSRIGRFLKSAVEEGVKYEVKGQVYKGVLGGEADFVSGSSGVLGEKVMSKLVGVFGVKLPNILKPIERLLGRGAGETGEETMQTIWQVYKESENFEDFKNTLGEQFATLKDVQHFVLSTALMGMAFGVIGELSKAWDNNRKKTIDKLKKEGKYTEEDEKQVNEILKDLTQEHETAVNDEIDNGVTLTDEEVMQMADEFTETTEVDGEEMKVVSKDEDKAIVLDETNNKLKQITLLAQGKGVVSTLTNDKINIANKLNQNIELNADEQDFYNNYKEDIEKIRYENQNAPIEPINTGEEQINSTGVSTETKDDTGLGTGNEQANVSDKKEVQQDDETEKEILEVKQVIQELETNPNSPFAKLVNLDEQKQKLAELEKKKQENALSEQKRENKVENETLLEQPTELGKEEGSGVGGDVKAKNKAFEELVNLIPTTDLRRPNGSIGTQGFSPENLVEVARHIAKEMGFDIPAYDKNKGTSEIKQVIDYLKNNKEAQQKIRDYVVKDPVVVSLLPDNTYEIEDGNHRANLLNLIGVDVIPTIELNGRDKQTAINEHNSKVEAVEQSLKETTKAGSVGVEAKKADIERKINNLPDNLLFITHITSDGKAEVIFNDNLLMPAGVSSTTGIIDKVALKQLLFNLAEGKSPHRGYLDLFIGAIDKSTLENTNGKTLQDKLENYLDDNFIEDVAKTQLPSSLNIGYFTNGQLNTKYDAELKALEQPIQSEIEAKKADIERTENDFNNENELYRVIVGDEAFNDIVESGVVRTNADNKGTNKIDGVIDLGGRPTAFPSFSKGSASMSYAKDNPNHYIIVTESASIQPSKSGRHGKGSTMFPTDTNGKHLKELDGSEVKVYKHIGEGKYELVYEKGKVKQQTNVEDWSKDVESTAKALWGVQKENADKFVNDFANIDIPFRQKNIQAEMDSEVKKQLFPNEKSRRKYAETIYSAVVRSGNFPKILSEAYHKAKADGSNPELVKAVEDLLGKANTNVTTPTKEVSTSENKIKSWIDKWEELKKENDNEQLDLFYNKVKVALNGYAQGKGVVDEFTKLKSEIEQFAKERKAKTNEEQSANADKVKTPENVAEISPNKNVSASKASAIKDLLADKYSDLKEMEAGILANLDGTESIDDLLEYVDWNRTTQKGGVYKGKGLKGSNIVKLIEKGYVEELSFMDENITLTDKGKKFQEALKARQETRKGIKEGTDLFPKDAGLSGKDLVGDALDRIASKLGGKKNLTEQERTSLAKDLTDLATGLIQEGKATLDNVIDKVKEYLKDELKKRGLTADETTINELADNIEQKVLFNDAIQYYKDKEDSYIYDENGNILFQAETELQSKGDNILNEFNPLLELDGDGIKTQETRIDEDYNTTDAEYEQTKFLVPIYSVSWYYADNTNPNTNTFDTLKDALDFANREGDMSENTYDTPYNQIVVDFREVWKDKDGNEIEDGKNFRFDEVEEQLPKEIVDLFKYRDGNIDTITFESNKDREKREQEENNIIDSVKSKIDKILKQIYPNYDKTNAGWAGQSTYINIKLNNGKNLLLRIANHNANTNNLTQNFEDDKIKPDYVISIVIQNNKIDIVKRFDNAEQIENKLLSYNPNVAVAQVIYDIDDIKDLGENGIVDEITEAISNIEKGRFTNFSGTRYQKENKNRFQTITQEAYDKLVKTLKKAFPNINVFSDEKMLKEKLKQYGVDVAEFMTVAYNAVEIEGKIQFLRTSKGTIYGAKLPDGSIYLNPKQINANTPIHEFAHIWEQLFPKEFAKGIELLMASEQGRAYIKKIRQNPAYAGRTLDEVKAEALVTAIGDKGETIFNNNPTLLKKFQDWLKDFFKTIGDKLGIINLSADERFEDFTKKVVGDLLGGKELKGESKAENIIAFQQDYAIESDFKKDSKGNIKKDEQGNPILTEKAKKEIAEEYAEIEKRYNGKAPNGKPSKLTKEQWILTRTSRFKDWFGDWENDQQNASKVVDDNGEPLVVYHQTKEVWEQFDKSKVKAGKFDFETPTGIFTKSNKNDIGLGSIQMPLFINLKNPLYFRNRSSASSYYELSVNGYSEIVEQIKRNDREYNKKVDEEIKKKAEKLNKLRQSVKYEIPSPEWSKAVRENSKTIDDILDEWSQQNDILSEKAKALIDKHIDKSEYDGVLLLSDKGSWGRETDAFIAINPNQIKSATDNIGTFDSGSNDIRFQIEDNQKETKNLLQNVIDNGINIDDLINYWKENNFDFDEQNIRDTYAELTQEVETKLDEEIKENSVESTDDSSGKTKKKTLVYKRIYTDKKTTQEEKEALEKLGLDYKVESQTKVANDVIKIIDEIGLDSAFGMARSGEFTPSYRNYIYAKVLEDLRNRIFIETNEEQRKSLIEERTEIANELDIKLRNEGRGGSIMKRAGADTMLNYDVAWREAEFKEEFDKEISKETKEKLLELEKRLAEQEAKIRELEEKQKNFTADDTIKAIKSKGKKRTASYKAKVLADRFRKLKTKPLELKDANGNPINITLNSVVSYNEIIEIGAKIIEKGGQLLEAINEVLKKLEEQEWFQKLNDNDKKAIERQITDHLSIDDNIDEDIKIPKDLLYDLVEKGLEINPNYSIDNLVDDVIETLGLDVADKREIRDKITNYGEEIKMPEGKVHEKLRELKRIGKLLSGIEDLEQGQLPKRSGLQRDETTTEERRLRQIINEKLKEIQKSDEVLESEWKSALDKLKTRYKKRIEDLKAQIDAKEKTIKEKNVIKLDDDALKLKTELSEVLKAYKEMFGNNELSAEARIKMREKALKKQIADTQNRIEYIKEKGKDVEKKKPSKVESDLITTLEQDLAKEKKELLELQKTKGLIDKKKIELAKARVEKQIAEYERRIKEKDFSKKEKYVLPFDEELNKAKLAKYHAKKEFDTLFYREELKNRSMQRVIYDFILDLINTPKSLKATLDLSAPLRQGATLLLSNNKEFRKAFIEMHKMAKNKDYYDNFLADLEQSEDYILIKDSGLVITDVDGKLEVKEETFMLGLANKIPILKIFNKASERGYSGFLNSLRVGVFRDGVEQLKKAGITFENNPKAYKALANFVNNATGRGELTTSEGTNKLLNTLFFSPRMITSRIGMIYTLFDPDAPMVVKKMSAKSLASFALYVSVVNVLGTILVNALDDDDDDDELKDKLNKNPLATDFLKVKYDDTRYDITAGYSTIIRTLARFIKGERINSQGKIKELDGSGYYGETRWSEIGAFFSNKFAPTTRVLYNVSTGKHPEDYYKTIDDATTKDYLKALFVPIGVESLYEDITDKEKEELKIATDFLLNFYGVSVQKY